MNNVTSQAQGPCLVSRRCIRVARRLPLAASRYGSHNFFRCHWNTANAAPCCRLYMIQVMVVRSTTRVEQHDSPGPFTTGWRHK